MLKCVVCNARQWDGRFPNCAECLLKRKIQLPEVSENIFNKLVEVDVKILEDINVDAHARFNAFKEYRLLREWSSDRIFLEYVEAADVMVRTTVPINIPLAISESDYHRIDFGQYVSPRE